MLEINETDMRPFFYEAVDILNDNLDLLKEMSKHLQEAGKFDKTIIEQYAQKVKVYEEVENV